MKPKLALCYYPTHVAFIDDDAYLLDAIKLALGGKFSCITYTDPTKALNHANEFKKLEWGSIANDADLYHSESDQLIKNALNISAKKMENNSRYNEVSVVVVDYDMPEMNGLDFCRLLKNPNIKKIMLTGRIGADEAVQAFNEGLINYYISKSDSSLTDKLRTAIENMQVQYFLDISSSVKIKAIDNNHSLFIDSKLSEYIEKKLEEFQVDEYYFLTHPNRYLLKSVNGDYSTLFIYSRYDLNQQIEVIKEEAGPKELIDALKTGRYVPYFLSEDGFYDQSNFDPTKTLIVADVIEGQDTYYCAHVVDDRQPIDLRMIPTNKNIH